MADKDFIVKNGIIVNTNEIYAPSTGGKVGIFNSSPDANLSVTGTANVSGNTTIAANLTVSSNLYVSNYASITGNANVGGNFGVAGAATFGQANVGANVQITATALFIGNSTVNTSYNVSTLNFSNSTVTSNLSTDSLKIGANVVVNTSTIFTGNSTVNVVTTTSTTTYANATTNTQINSGLIQLGNTTAALFKANTTAVLIANTIGLNVNGTVGTAGQVLTSNGTIPYWANPSSAANSTGGTGSIQYYNGTALGSSNAFIISATTNSVMVANAITLGDPSATSTIATINSTSYGGKSADSDKLAGLAASGYVNTSGTYTLSGQHTHSNTTVFSGAIVSTNTFTANGVVGSAGQVLTSGGLGANVYWSTSPNTAAQYIWSNTQTFNSVVNLSGNVYVSNVIYANASIGSAGWVLTTSGGTGNVYWSAPVNSNSAGGTGGVQFHNGSSFGASAGMIFASAGNNFTVSNTITATGNLVTSTGLQVGSYGGASSNGVNINNTSISIGNSTVFATINSTSYTGTVNVANVATYIATASNFGNSSGIYAVSYNAGSTGLGTGGIIANTTTFFVGNNLSNAFLTTAGLTINAVTVANTSGVYTGTVNAASYTVGTSTVANSTGIYTGVVNATTTNSATLSVGTSFIANTSQLTVATPLSANGSTGTAGYILVSNGSVGSPYWAVNPGAYTIGSSLTNTGGTLTVNAAYIATITANNALYLGNQIAANFVNTAQLAAFGYVNSTSGTANNALYLSGVASASYVQNTDSRTLSGNLTFSANATFSGANVTFGPSTYINAFKDANNNVVITSNYVYSISNTTSYALYGKNNLSGPAVQGDANTGTGIFGTSLGGNGALISSNTGTGLWVQSNTGPIFLAGKASGYTGFTTEYFRITNAGNVGIGNASPSDALSVNGTTYHGGNVILGSPTVAVGLQANGSYGAAGAVLSSNGTATYWTTSPNINANNASYLGTVIASSYAQKTDVHYIGTTSIALNRASASQSLTGVSIDGSAATFTSTTQNSQFNSLGVGTTASGTAGEIRATNNITAYYSDDRLKVRKNNIENALTKVQSLSGFHYEANELAQSMGYKAVPEIGVSAQEVQAILPEIVAPAPIDENYLTVRYERLVPLLIEAIKELKKEIDELKSNR